MKRRSVELEHREWPTKGDAQRVVYAVCTWYPTDRDTGAIWEIRNPFGTWNWTVCELPRGARRSVTWDDKARAGFVAYVADFLGEYLERYGLSIDADAPSTCAP